MPETAQKETFRSFTLRIPTSLYCELSDLARSEGVFINQKANQLLRLGMGKHIDLNQALERLLKSEVVKETTND
jgi:hypothetical protein